MTFFHLLTLVTYLILSLFISSLEAAGVLRNATLHDNDLMSISRFSYGWRQVAHPGAIGGEHAYNRQAGGWVEVELPGEHNPQPLVNAFFDNISISERVAALYYVGVPDSRGSQYLVCFDCNTRRGFERVVELADDSPESRVRSLDLLSRYIHWLFVRSCSRSKIWIRQFHINSE